MAIPQPGVPCLHYNSYKDPIKVYVLIQGELPRQEKSKSKTKTYLLEACVHYSFP